MRNQLLLANTFRPAMIQQRRLRSDYYRKSPEAVNYFLWRGRSAIPVVPEKEYMAPRKLSTIMSKPD